MTERITIFLLACIFVSVLFVAFLVYLNIQVNVNALARSGDTVMNVYNPPEESKQKGIKIKGDK